MMIDPWGMENRGEGVNFHCLPSCQNVLLLLFSDKVYQGKAVTTAWALWCQEVHRCLPLTQACPLWQWAQADLSEREELTGPWASTWSESCCWRLLTPWEKNLILQEAMPWYTNVHSSTDRSFTEDEIEVVSFICSFIHSFNIFCVKYTDVEVAVMLT